MAHNQNKFWLEVAEPAINQISQQHSFRPQIERNHIDFKHDRFFEAIEAAHILAHIRGGTTPKKGYAHSSTRHHFLQAFAEIAISLMYNIPVNVSPQYVLDGKANMPYGIKVYNTTNYLEPTLMVPSRRTNALVPSTISVVILVSIHVDPYPARFFSSVLQPHQDDKWGGMPTIATTVGYAYPSDVLQKEALIDTWQGKSYILPAPDMLSSDHLPEIIRLGAEMRGEQKASNTWKYMDKWIDSEEYHMLKLEYEPLPCRDCLLTNRDSESKIPTPSVAKPKKLTKKSPWYTYEQEVKRLLNVIKEGIWLGDAEYVSLKEAKNYWRERRRNYKRKQQRDKDVQAYMRAVHKTKTGKRLTKREQKVYLEMGPVL